MKAFTLRYSLLVIVVLIIGTIVFWGNNLIDWKTTDAIASGSFRSASVIGKFNESDFERLPIDEAEKRERHVTFVWVHRVQLRCRIEVEVDRKFANARPIMQCKG
jgi:hypothetical protein